MDIKHASSHSFPSGCNAKLVYDWTLDPATAPPGNPTADIVVTGPTDAGPYTVQVENGKVELELDVPLGSANDKWTANLVSVGGRNVFPTPLDLSFDYPNC